MKCVNPKKIKNPSFRSFDVLPNSLTNSLNYDFRSNFNQYPNSCSPTLEVPCGHCWACLANRRSQWVFRLKQELKYSKGAVFVTLTYDDDNLPFLVVGDTELAVVDKSEVQKYIKRIRKFYYGSKKSDFRYFLVSEYSPDDFRPHYHAIFFNLPQDKLYYLEELWNKGFIRVDPITPERIGYVTKYCLAYNRDSVLMSYPKAIRPFMVCSKGIGKGFLSQDRSYLVDNLKTTLVHEDCSRSSLPRYYKEKLFTKQQFLQLSVKNNKSISDKRKSDIRELGLTGLMLKEKNDYAIFSRHCINSIKKKKFRNYA